MMKIRNRSCRERGKRQTGICTQEQSYASVLLASPQIQVLELDFKLAVDFMHLLVKSKAFCFQTLLVTDVFLTTSPTITPFAGVSSIHSKYTSNR